MNDLLLVIILMVSGYYTRNEHSKNHTLHPSISQIWINRSCVVVVADGKTDDDEQDSLPSSAGSEKSSGSSWASRHVAGTHPWASSVLTNHQPEKSERRMSDDDRRFIYQHLTMTVPPLSSLGSLFSINHYIIQVMKELLNINSTLVLQRYCTNQESQLFMSCARQCQNVWDDQSKKSRRVLAFS